MRSKAPYLVLIAVAIAASIPVYGYRWHLTLHILGAVVFLGNIVVTAMWMALARSSGNVPVIAFAARTVARTDWLFTAPGVVLVLGNGLALAADRYGGWSNVDETAWISLALLLFVASGVVWVGFLLRYQAAMVRLSHVAATGGSALPQDFFAAYNRWAAWGILATVLPLVSLYLMVARPTLWD